MVITRISDFGFKVAQGTTTIAINPPISKSASNSGVFGADIVLLSAPQVGFDSAVNFSKKDDETFVIATPGEYERSELFVYGLASKTNFGGGDNLNVVYYFNLDSIDVLVLGAHESDSLPNELTELVDNVDILIIPVVGDEVLSSSAASKIAAKLEASIVLPSGTTIFDSPAINAFSDDFSHTLEVTDKLTLRSNDIPDSPKAYLITV